MALRLGREAGQAAGCSPAFRSRIVKSTTRGKLVLQPNLPDLRFQQLRDMIDVGVAAGVAADVNAIQRTGARSHRLSVVAARRAGRLPCLC